MNTDLATKAIIDTLKAYDQNTPYMSRAGKTYTPSQLIYEINTASVVGNHFVMLVHKLSMDLINRQKQHLDGITIYQQKRN